MREFLKRLFGRSADATQAPAALVPPDRRSRSVTEHDAPPDQVPMASKHTGDAVVHRYFALINTVLRAKADSDFPRAIRAARDTYPLMPAVVRQIKKEYGEFDIGPSAAVHTAGTLMAVMGDLDDNVRVQGGSKLADSDRDVRQRQRDMLRGFAKTKVAGFWKLPAEALFLEILKHYNEPTTYDSISARAEGDVVRLALEGATADVIAAATARRKLELHEEIFDQCYRRFFFVDKYPEIAERFILSFSTTLLSPTRRTSRSKISYLY